MSIYFSKPKLCSDVNIVGFTRNNPSETNPPKETTEPPSATPAANHENDAVGAEEQEHLKRRKRRKTEDFESSDTASWPSTFPSPTREQDAFVKKSDQGEQNTTRDTGQQGSIETGVGASSAAGKSDSTASTPPKRRTLQLNANGKLLNSPPAHPKKDQKASTTATKRKTRPRKKAPPSHVVSLKYGSDEESRQRIGGLINAILHEGKPPSTTIPVQPPVEQKPKTEAKSKLEPPKKDEPPKPVHPFFLGKAKQSKPAASKQPQDRSPLSTNIPAQSASKTASPPAFPTSLKSFPLSKATNSSKSPNSLEPIWPPHGIVHVRGSVPSLDANDSNIPPIEYHEKKAKGAVVNIPKTESVLSLPQGGYDQPLINSDLEFVDPILRYPKQLTLSGNKIRELTVEELVTTTRNGIGNQLVNGKKRLDALHPALQALISSIPTAQSAFDRCEPDDTPWTQKYAPKNPSQVLQPGPEAYILHEWLRHHQVSSVSTTESKFKKSKEEEQKKKRKRKKPKDLHGFIISSSDEEMLMDELSCPEDDSDEDELSGGVTVKRSMVRSVGLPNDSKRSRDKKRAANAVLLSGPPGCGKTAAVYSVAKDLAFEIFELNPGARRSARDVVERVGDMSQNHLVQLLDDIDKGCPILPGPESNGSSSQGTSEGQSTMNSFFKKKPAPAKKKSAAKHQAEDTAKSTRNQKQSLILLEEVDVLFEEDKQFWAGVLALISQSKRPIVMTCNDENTLPLDDLSLHAIFRFRPPPRDLAVDYLLLIAANEGHVLERQPVADLYTVLKKDLRSSIMQLNFWCQMAVGSRKCGLDWLVNRPASSTEPGSTEVCRTVSSDTYTLGMGWYSQDVTTSDTDSTERKAQMLTDCLDQWNLGLTDWEEVKETPVFPNLLSRIDALIQDSDIADLKSDLDLMAPGSPGDITKVSLILYLMENSLTWHRIPWILRPL